MAERTPEPSSPVAAPSRAPAPAPRMVVLRPAVPVAAAAVNEGPKTPPWRAWEAGASAGAPALAPASVTAIAGPPSTSAPTSPATIAAGVVAPRSITAAIPIAPAVALGRAPAPAAPPTVVAAASVATPGTASVAAVTARGTAPTAIAAPGSLGVPLLTPLSLGAFQPRDPGQPLPSSVRTRLQPTHGAPAVTAARVHSDDEARAVTQAMGGARAVAIGAHVYFAPGEYRPGTPEGDKLIAHEIAHVVQWLAGSLRGPAMKGPGDGAGGAGHEAHADAMAAKAAKGDGAPAKGEGAGKGEQNSPGAPKAAEAAPGAAGDAGGGAGPEPMMPEGPSELTPDAKARVARAEDKAGDATKKQADVPVAESEVGTARASVAEPAAEAKGRASAELAATLDDREPPSPEIEEVCKRIKKAIHDKQPPDKDSLVKADPEQLAKAAGDEQKAKVDGDVKKVKGSYDDMKTPDAQPAPAPPAAPETQGSVASPDPNARTATPTPVAKDKVSLDADVKNSQQQMTDAGMTSEPAKLVEDGPIADARDAQGELSEEAKKSPAAVLAEQSAALQHASADMAALQKNALAALASARKGHVGKAESQKKGMKLTEEEQRAQAGKEAQTLFDDAEKAVKEQLTPLTDRAMEKWEAGVRKLSTEFKQHLQKVQDWLDARYGKNKNADTLNKIGGALAEGWDDVTGKPQWVTDEYNKAEETFGDGVCALITDISRSVNTVVKACQGIIDQARKDIAAVYKKLPESLQKWAAAEQDKFGKKLDGLNQQVTTARDDFNKDLVQRASQAVQEVREQIHALREAAKGLLGKLKDAINEFLDDPVKAIINGLLKVLGIPPDAFWAVLAKIAQAAKDIADDPMNFANNLVAGLGKGFSQFFDNIGTHLLVGFWEWLFGGLKKDGTPIELPKEYSLKGLMLFFLQFLGISWAKVRKLLVEQLGETTVKVLETTWDVVTTLITKGVAGLWELIHDKIKPADIVQGILTAAIEYVVQQVVIKVAARIVGMLNPAGAILQALELIYRVLKWVFNNAARIFRLVEAVVNGISDVIAGNIGGVAKVVERALAMLIPPVIDFIADYLGFGGLPGKVAETIKGFQATVEAGLRAAIKWVVDKAKAIINAILKKLGLKKDDKDKDKNKKKGAGTVGERVAFGAEGESHSLFVQVSGKDATLMVASSPMTAGAWLRTKEEQLPDLGPAEKQKPARDAIGAANNLIGKADKEADEVAAANAAPAAPDAAGTAAPGASADLNTQLKKDEEALAAALENVLKAFGAGKPSGKWAAEIAKSDPNAIPVITEALDAEPKKYLKPKEWVAVTKMLAADARIAAILDKPLLLAHAFGSTAHSNQAVPAVTRAIASLGDDAPDKTAEDAVSGYKAQVHARTAPFGASRSVLAEQVFLAGQKASATTTLQDEFRTKLTQVEQEEHKRFKPQNLIETKVGDKVIAIDYITEDGSKFHVTFDASGMVESITGAGLVLKGTGDPRGYTGDAGRKTTDQGIDSAHLIADRFGGSGYATSANLISASATYNRVDMLGVEDKIASWIYDNKIPTFSMKVKVTWDAVAGAKAIASIEAAYPEYAAPKKRKKLEKDLATFLSANSTNLKRCMSTVYVVTSEDGKLSKVFRLGADVHLGLS